MALLTYRETRLIFKRWLRLATSLVCAKGAPLFKLALLLKLALLASTLLLSSGCALFQPEPSPLTLAPQTTTLEASYDEVWRALQKALVKYPIQINNIDQGIIETDFIKGSQVWDPPFSKENKKINRRYNLKVNAVKGTVNNKPSTRLTISKNIYIDKDFFSGEERLPSDGFEEKAVLYRIYREIVLERSLKKSFERKGAGS